MASSSPILSWALLTLPLLLGGVQTKTAMAIMNCIQARDSCMNNTACHPILEVVPRVCGAEKVACSTVTITKCQAALRTLQAFPYFYPTCLCREPMSDPACNTFRDYLFDHPCSLVKDKEKDPYPVDALPKCDYAVEVCRKEAKCFQLLRDFRHHCKADHKDCVMADGEKCHDAWTKLRLSPIFGCICPSPNAKCDRIFREVNYNPCVATDPVGALNGSRSALFSLELHKLARQSPHMSFSPAALFPPQPGPHLHNHYSPKFRHFHPPSSPAPPGTAAEGSSPQPPPLLQTQSHLFLEESSPVSVTGSFSPQPPPSGSIAVRVHAGPDEAQLETPLITSSSSSPTNKPITSIRNPKERPRVGLAATCLWARNECKRDPACGSLLDQMVHYCDPGRCRQETCMKALQKFYQEVEPKWGLDVAFCMCRTSEGRQDQCHIAQQQLHPACAQRGDPGVNPPSCRSLAEQCRAETDCRLRLEEYEQACAVDSVTRKCAGPTEHCRSAMIRILGTRLRTQCACNGTDFTQLYDCLGWQRILWVNPCVVESQKDYHRLRISSSGGLDAIRPGPDILSTTMGAPPRGRIHLTSPMVPASSSSTTTSTTTANMKYQTEREEEEGVVTEKATVGTTSLATTTGKATSQVTSPGTSATSTATSTSTTSTTTTSTTTMRTEPTTTLLPPKYCRLTQVNAGNRRIREGQSKRLYREDIPTCSELCTCGSAEKGPMCMLLECLEVKHCYVKTEDEYMHLQPTYIAHRGKCLCYSGHFICEKPPPDTYTLDNGVFLFLGFSKKDEELLSPVTRLGVRDVVEALRQLVSPHTRPYFLDETDPEESAGLERLRALNSTECRLGLYKVEEENVIINATVFEEEFPASSSDGVITMRQPNDQLFLRERRLCLPVLQVLKDLINKQHPIIHGHSLLSILKLAAVQDNIPTPEPSSASPAPPRLAPLLPLLLLTPLLHPLL